MIDDIRLPQPKKTNKAEAPKPTSEPTSPVVAAESIPVPEITIDLGEATTNKKRTNPLLERWHALSRRGKIFAVIGAVIVILALGSAVYFLFIEKPPKQSNTPVIQAVAPPKSNTIAAPLTGLPIDPALAKRPVTAIMIENSLDARPQSGLQDAGVVYEAIAEGGITRFMGIFQDAQPQYVGPVRSLRPYYLDFALPYQASIAHVGGSPEALAQVRSGPRDIDQFFNAGSYWRQPTRDAPHNVYTSFEKLDALNQSKGYTSSNFISWPRKKDSPAKNPAAKSIDLNISSTNFNVHYDWDPKVNVYYRFEGGAPHLVTASADDASPKQLQPKVVIALISSYGIESDGQHSEYNLTGNGQIYIFQDGGVTQGTWNKVDRESQFVFKDAAGKEINLNAGQTWITLLSDASKVSYSP